VISPLLANLFLQYVLDVWMRRKYSGVPFERCADDIICHCRSLKEAQVLKAALEIRMAQYHLQLHPEKTQVVFCKDGNHNKNQRSLLQQHPHPHSLRLRHCPRSNSMLDTF
jgi:retron-type reverse transcriptase